MRWFIGYLVVVVGLAGVDVQWTEYRRKQENDQLTREISRLRDQVEALKVKEISIRDTRDTHPHLHDLQ